jgi:hypothetical protein
MNSSRKPAPRTSAKPTPGTKGRPDGGSTALEGDCPLALDWVDVSKAFKSAGDSVFTPRCAHAVSVLAASSTLSNSTDGVQTSAFVSIGGCSETEYFPLEDVRDRLLGIAVYVTKNIFLDWAFQNPGVFRCAHPADHEPAERKRCVPLCVFQPLRGPWLTAVCRAWFRRACSTCRR